LSFKYKYGVPEAKAPEDVGKKKRLLTGVAVYRGAATR
jgi:hypothetical protein